MPDVDLIPSLLAASDVFGTGWFGAVAVEAGPGKTVVVVGDGAVGLLAGSWQPSGSASTGSSTKRAQSARGDKQPRSWISLLFSNIAKLAATVVRQSRRGREHADQGRRDQGECGGQPDLLSGDADDRWPDEKSGIPQGGC